tara:strand:+ start:47760 stop:48215 length:456 start_codon:yes stop_codon:yes gene_type:complete
MIDIKNRIVTQLLATIHIDKKDPSVMRVDMNNAVNILSNHGYNLPSKIYETKLEEVLNKKLTGHAKVSAGLKYSIAEMIVVLAEKMHVDEAQIVKYITEHNTEEDAAELATKIKDWRAEYYGSMDKAEKQALVDTLSEKLRPDVLEQIRRA